jgi:hypothetical protein
VAGVDAAVIALLARYCFMTHATRLAKPYSLGHASENGKLQPPPEGGSLARK